MNSNTIDVFEQTVQEYSDKFKNISITLIIRDAKHKKHVLANKGVYPRNKYVIIYGEYNDMDMDATGSTYFVSTVDDLRQVLQFMYEHIDIFITPKTEDVYDNCEVISLDDLESDLEDDELN